jgi:hypothetical protein
MIASPDARKRLWRTPGCLQPQCTPVFVYAIVGVAMAFSACCSFYVLSLGFDEIAG